MMRRDELNEYAASRRMRRSAWLLFFFVLLIFLSLLSFSLGHYPVPLTSVIRAVFAQIFPNPSAAVPAEVNIALFHIRLPRILLGILAGAGLSVSGASFQAVFRNPIVSPDLLGASAGAAFGAALGIISGFSSTGISLAAFFSGLIAVALVLLLSGQAKAEKILSLLLCGIVVSSLFSAALSYLKLIADPSNELPAITYWLMGSLASARMGDLAYAAPPILLGTFVMWILRWQLNLLTLGDEQARSMGVEAGRVRLILILAATLVTSTVVSFCGQIGWIGLVIPHISMLIFGADYRISLSATALIGSAFTLSVDLLARMLASSEIPIGILTAFFGAPLFFLLLIREGRR